MTVAGPGRVGQQSYNLPPSVAEAFGNSHRCKGGWVPVRQPTGLKELCVSLFSMKIRPWIISRFCVWIHARPSLP